jgi:autotransporter strand-loop-strand O-heptosyltransferase
MKIVYLAPHLSCGGCPQVILKRIQALMLYVDNVEIYLIEHNDYGKYFPTQRNQIIDILEDRFYSLDKNKMEAMDIINDINPDLIHIDEMSERLDRGLITALYNNNRTYRIIETCHDISFDPNSKIFQPDLFLFCSPYHEDTFSDLDSRYHTIQYPIDFKTIRWVEKVNAKRHLGMDVNKKHILNVGIWTKGKNQSEGLEIARQYPDCMFHFVGAMASNFSEYWEPLMKDIPDNVKIWGERSDVEDFMTAADVFMFNSTWECNPLVLREAAAHGLPIMARNLPQYGDMFQKYLDPIHSDPRTLTRKYKFVNSTNSRVYALEHQISYDAILKFPIRKQSVQITQNFISQPFLEIKGISDSNFLVKFFDEKGSIVYENTIKSNCWVKLNRQYYTKYTAKVWQDDELIYSNTLNLEGKRVFISIDSKALGDTLAWIGYCLEFKKKHNCELVVSTFWNKILDYPELELVEPGHVTGCYMMLHLGWFWDADKEPVLCNTIPLQQSASNILGLDFIELRPKLKFDIKENLYGDYITIATNSTAGLKFWLRDFWQQIINYLAERGYKVINTSKEPNPLKNCYQLEDATIENTMSVIHHSKLFIGLSSGLSHLAWGLGKEIIMISGFSEPDHEFACHRPYNHKVCHGCWNDPAIKFDAGDYLFCPHHKNTDRMFECQNSITPEMVITEINKIL